MGDSKGGFPYKRRVGAACRGLLLSLQFLYFLPRPAGGQDCAPRREAPPRIEKDAISQDTASRFSVKKFVCPGWPIRRGVDSDGRLIYFTWDNVRPEAVPSDTSGKARRQWIFQFVERARQDIKLEIVDDVAVSGRDSRDTMHTALYFFPRRQLPHYEIISPGEMRLWLPTGESFTVDRAPGKVLGGVLAEAAPMDRRANRFTRKFPAIVYSGKGVMIRADQRGGQPEDARSFGVLNPFKKAVAYYRGRSCRLSPSDLWTQEGYLDFKYPSDREFFSFLEEECGWKVAEELSR